MTTNIPVVLEGSTLDQRHQQYNAIVNHAFQQKLDLQSELESKEKFPIDRLYKIDLACKHRDVKYILYNLKNDDMLYVSRALKSRWLLEPQYRDFINPRHLENEVFPDMTQPAVNKMRHWLHRNLKDNARCQEFYEYYKDRHEIAIKFFWHCSPDYILTEINNILHKLSPQDLKIICENCPQAAQVYFEGLHTNKEALSRYIEKEAAYFKSVQCVLKMNPTLYLDIIEKHYNLCQFGQLSPEATRFIMKKHKDRFNAKPELYAGYFLQVNTLANFINSKEAKDLVLKLARAEDIILCNVFKKMEPVIKRINVKERAAFKKMVFVLKDYGEKLKEWPYPVPAAKKVEEVYSIFKDKEHDPREYYEDFGCEFADIKCRFLSMSCAYADESRSCYINKTPLDILFDKYRFKVFEETYQEFCEKLLAESSVVGRMNLFLVLVSKSGGVPEQVHKLLTLLVSKHMNEPKNLRAAVIRSLVKRAYAWRMPDNVWNMIMKFGLDLGLDGNYDELECIEGLHAVVLRHLIKNEALTDEIRTAFLKETSTFKEYKLKIDEKRHVGPKLAQILLESNPDNFLNVLFDFKLNIKDIPDAEVTLVEKARTDKELLYRLYENKIGRRYLLKESFALFNEEASFINALRHNTSVLENGEIFAVLVMKKRPSHDRFLTSLALYFNESNGLAEQHRAKLIKAMKTNPQPWFARAITILSTNVSLPGLIQEVGVIEKKELNNKILIAAFKNTVHKSRPLLYSKDFDSKELKWLGAKSVANKVLICREKDRETYTKLLLQWGRTARIALRLALSSEYTTETFIIVSKLRPLVALKMAIKTFLRNKTIDPEIWKVTKKLIESLVTEKSSKYLCDQLRNNNDVPENIKAEYWETLYMVFLKIDKPKTLPILCRLENIQTTVNQNFIKSVMETFINEELVLSKFTDDYTEKRDTCLYVRILAKYLLTSSLEEEQEDRLKICDLFFKKISILRGTMKESSQFCSLYELLRKFMHALKYNKAFLGHYAPSYNVFERILVNISRILPYEKHLVLHLEIYLLKLHYKSLQQSIAGRPEIFKNIEKNLAQATETVGLQMGRNIDLEIKDMTSKYYFSIIDIYKRVLVKYLDKLRYHYEDNAIISPVLKGLLEGGQTQSLLLAEYLAKKSLPQSAHEELVKDLKAFNNENVNFFLYAM